MKAPLLSKLLLEATILAEKSGLRVDYWTGDGAPWNRALWKLLGIKGKFACSMHLNKTIHVLLACIRLHHILLVAASSVEITCKTLHPVDAARHLYMISDFPHLVKCVRNAFVSKGLQIPQGHVHVRPIREAWENDRKTVALKVMPRITQAHVAPNAFEKMRVNLAFQLFSEEVLKGLFFYKSDLQPKFRSLEPTEHFVRLMERLIFVMSSRTPAKGLRPKSKSTEYLEEFIIFLSEWEEHAAKNGGGFLSPGTALGLRVTLKSTLCLLDYLTSTLSFKYLLTANLSQDKVENVFGIVRQSFGCNDHPTPEQFLTIINNLSFYSLARPPRGGNSQPELITALLEPSDACEKKTVPITALVDRLLDDGNLADAAVAIEKHSSLLDHKDYAEKKSDSRLIYYIAGYVVRKSLKRISCPECASSLCILPVQATSDDNASLTKEFDHGGLLYPSKPLELLVTKLENTFTVFFSRNKLHAESMTCFLSFIQGYDLEVVGCPDHGREVTANVVKFYALTRLHFLAKACNKSRSSHREKQKLLKMRRCQ